MFPLSVSTYVKIGLFIVLVCGSFYGGWHTRDVDFSVYKDQVRIAAEKQIADNEAKQKEQELINKGVSDAYEARINSIHAMYGRMQYASGGSVSSSRTATITINGETHNILSVAEECAQTTQQLISLQDWVNQQVSLNGH